MCVDFKNWQFFFAFVWIRLIMAVLSKSYHHPDETYQSVEVAHYLIFGRGYLTWEWTTKYPIRSYLHPLMFAGLFGMLKVLNLDSTEYVILLPRMFQGLISAVGDLCTFKFFLLYFGGRRKTWFLLAYITNSSLLYFMSRTLINGLETALGSISMYFYALSITKLTSQGKHLRKYEIREETAIDEIGRREIRCPRKIATTSSKKKSILSNKATAQVKSRDSEFLESNWSEYIYVTLITLSFIIRATTAILWLPLVSYHIFLLCQTGQFGSVLMKRLAPLSLLLIITTIVIDSICHGSIVFVHWNFFHLNLLVDVSSQCGKQPLYGYVLIGMWTVNFVGLFLFPGIIKAWKFVPEFRVYIVAGFSTFFILSSISHKEVRFWLPCVPLCLCVSAYYMQTCNFVLRNKMAISFLTIICNFMLLYYELFFVQFGPSNVTTFLHKDITHLQTTINRKERHTHFSVLYMTNCYETPLYSHLHLDVEIDIAACPLIIEEDWKSTIDRRRKHVWLNDDSDLLSEWPHLYLFKYFRHPINESEFKLDKFNQKYLLNPNNTWNTFYIPEVSIMPENCNLTEKMIEYNKRLRLTGWISLCHLML